MGTFEMLFQGFAQCFTAARLLACAGGVLIGTLTGVLPGIGVTGAMALLLPLSFNMDATSALILFAGIYYGAMYGGSTTSILVNLPGEAASVVTCLDGHAMAKKGRAGAALAISALGSFIAGTLGIVALTFTADKIAKLALAFQSPEYFAICLLGLILLTNLSGKNAMKSALMVLFGLALGTIGIDDVFGVSRFDFGSMYMSRGLEFSVVAMAVFGISEMLGTLLEPHDEDVKIQKLRLRDLYPNKMERKRSRAPILRASVLGFLIGLMPGPAGTLASFSSYAMEKKISKHPEEFGKGAIEGVAGPEAANNAASSAAFVPLLSLGLPFAPPAALLLTAFITHGITPGPTLFTQHAGVFWGLIASMYIGNVLLLVINLPLVGVFASLLKCPTKILMPIVMVITFTGAFATNGTIFDILILIVLGVLAYVVSKYGFSMAPLAVGICISSTIEQRFQQTIIGLKGDVMNIFNNPIACVMLALAVVLVIGTVASRTVKKVLANSKED
ncbi:MAG: tripartite tricarboxylate transporter permease [Sphaerochaetaceae bacterium]|jgi:putative tricarboxylic transport membrane protein|nr:tripartite tricarboxylate transporter permease [Sphaerochaetaceae bacterium]